MESFKLSKEFTIICNYKNTQNGFKHTATLLKNGSEITSAKCCYCNRTWERFTYETVLHKVINSHFDEKTAKKYIKKLKPKENKTFKTVALACAVGDILCKTTTEKNKWNKKMINTIPGIDLPKDFDNLPEKEKTRRLKGVLKIIKE